ncbi:MAG: transglycosylase family protein [Solirubrobacteraceae bacterium]|nr:transglycosylase family protein [Solirubrobacteraceae bacterium]
MIASPTHAAPRRTPARRALVRPLAWATAVLTATLLATGATPASAASGGVTVTTKTKTKARGAASDTAPVARPKSVSKAQLKRAQTLLRIYASGTHDANTRKVVKRFQNLRGLPAHGVVNLATYIQIKDAFALLETGGIGVTDESAEVPGGGGITTDAPATPEFVVPPNVAPITTQERQILDKIAKCESNGDHTIVSANGLYRGKYQFDRATWKSVGGTGDPAAASEEEQDQRAAILLRQRGTAPWPVCGL